MNSEIGFLRFNFESSEAPCFEDVVRTDAMDAEVASTTFSTISATTSISTTTTTTTTSSTTSSPPSRWRQAG